MVPENSTRPESDPCGDSDGGGASAPGWRPDASAPAPSRVHDPDEDSGIGRLHRYPLSVTGRLDECRQLAGCQSHDVHTAGGPSQPCI